jgi:hypothetical protein
MEATRYRRLCARIDQAAGQARGRKRRQQFSDSTIVKVFYRATHCDRPVSWACDPDNWPATLLDQVIGGPESLPGQSTMSRRLRTIGVLHLIERVQTLLADMLGADVLKVIDSKPLRVGRYSKDRDATRGRAGSGEMARGYKLHAITCGNAFRCWTILPMNENDQVGAAILLPRLSDHDAWGYVSADNAYDANPLYRQAASVNHQLIAPPRRANAHVRDTRRNTPQRIRSLDICADPLSHCGLTDSFGLGLRRQRDGIERNFGHLVMDGLHAPPPWVRTPHRIAIWTAAKIIGRMDRQLELLELRRR